MRVAPHDLLRIPDDRVLTCPEDAPSWVAASLELAPYVVVRRNRSWNERVPVGVRGPMRHQRFGAYLAYDLIQEKISPEELSQEQGWLGNKRSTEIPALKILASVKEILDSFALKWGPTGSVGFELASQIPTTTGKSDLDLIIRSPSRISRQVGRSVHTALCQLPCRIDVQIETTYGMVFAAEWANGEGPYLRKELTGPVLVDDPWEAGLNLEKSSATPQTR
jgi:phosphoribosyl-dephospho-CoA transferase